LASPEDYSGLLFFEGHAKFYAEVHETIDVLRADGAGAQATLLQRAYDEYIATLEKISVAIAAKAEAYIVEEERSSRVRPDTEGGGGPRLEEFIGKSDPLPSVPGSVGVNNEEALRHSPVYWWWTNEEGYAGFVGEERQGFFFGPGGGGQGFIPSSHMAGQHPIFKPYGGKAPTMIIEQEIPERRFVEHGYEKAEAEWHADVSKARATFMAELTRIMALP
jgi:hypothetical protein